MILATNNFFPEHQQVLSLTRRESLTVREAMIYFVFFVLLQAQGFPEGLS